MSWSIAALARLSPLHRLRAETKQAQRLDRSVDRATSRTDGSLSLLTAAASGRRADPRRPGHRRRPHAAGELAVLIAALAWIVRHRPTRAGNDGPLSAESPMKSGYPAQVGVP